MVNIEAGKDNSREAKSLTVLMTMGYNMVSLVVHFYCSNNNNNDNTLKGQLVNSRYSLIAHNSIDTDSAFVKSLDFVFKKAKSCCALLWHVVRTDF